MKTQFLKLLMSVLAGFAVAAFSGCASRLPFSKKSQSPAASVPTTTVGQQTAGGGASQSSQGQASSGPAASSNQRPAVSAATMRASMSAAQQPGRVFYASVNNLTDPWQSPVSDAIVWVKNIRKENVFLQLGDRAVGVSDGNGNLMLVILPPGETFGIPDYKQRPVGYPAKTQIDANILDADYNVISFLSATPTWPTRGYYWGKEMRWDLLDGDAAALPNGPAPIKIPVDPNRNTGVISLTSNQVQVLQNAQQALMQLSSSPPAPVQPAPTPAPSLSPTTP